MEGPAPGSVHRDLTTFTSAAEHETHARLSVGCREPEPLSLALPRSFPPPHCVSYSAGREVRSLCWFAPCSLLKNGVSITPWCPEAAPQDQQNQGLWPEWAAHQQSCLHPLVTAPRIGPELRWNYHEKWKQSAPSLQSQWILSKTFQRFDTTWQPNKYFGNQNLQLLVSLLRHKTE